MAKKYVKRGNYNTLDEYVLAKTGKHVFMLNNFREVYKLPKIKNIANRILAAIKANRKIYVYADYDCDGITSACQFVLLLQKLGAKFIVKIPKRFTDGYGIKPEFAGTVEPGSLLILVDNGIAALEAVALAKERNVEVIIMDHHMAVNDNGKILYPNADIILDPEAIPENNDFCEYCGAGLTYKLVSYMLPSEYNLLNYCVALAAIGTVADMVPLAEDNRQIVKNGLAAINSGRIMAGLKTLICELDYAGRVMSDTIAYYLAPILNASGRLYDEGATWSAITLLEQDAQASKNMVTKLIKINDDRKQIVDSLMQQIYIDPNDKVNVIRTPDGSPLGCLGLVAGKITEATKRTTFVYTNTGSILKGSARSDDEVHNHVKEMLDAVSSHMAAYGGHPGAAGFSFTQENEDIIRKHLLACPVQPHDMTPYYDLEVKPQDMQQYLRDLDICEPFGKGLERPIFSMRCNFGSSQGYWNSCGKNGEHISFSIPGTNFTAIAFHMHDKYMKDGYPRNIRLVGNLAWNYYKGIKKPQFVVDDYEIL